MLMFRKIRKMKKISLVGLNELDQGRICPQHTDGCGKMIQLGDEVYFQPVEWQNNDGSSSVSD